MNWQGTEQFFRFCKYLLGVSLFGLCAAMLFSKSPRVYALETDYNTYATPATRLEDWRFNPEALQLEIVLSSATQPQYFFLSQPSRIVVDIPGTKLGYVPTHQNYSGAIRSIRVSQFNADVTRIVLDLAPGTFLDRTQFQLQPISWQNPTRWVLRPSIASDRTSFPTGNMLPPSGNFAPTNITPPLPNDLPPGIYSPQPPDNSLPDTYSPQPSGNLPPGIYPPQPPDNLLPDTYSPQPSGNLPPGIYPPQPSRNLVPNTYNTPSVSTFYTNPQFKTLPPTTDNSQQAPFIRVPPININNRVPPTPTLPPANFPSPLGNYNNNVPSVGTTNFPVPTIPNYPPSSSNSGASRLGAGEDAHSTR